MPSESKPRNLHLLRYLYENTDDNHTVTIADMGAFLDTIGISANRHTIAGDIEQLRSFGVDIVCNSGKPNRYFIGQRQFDLAELKLLVDAVQSSRFITSKKSKAIIGKLSGLTSVYQAESLNRNLYVEKRCKAANESVLYSIDILHSAINGAKKVKFCYCDYTADKKRVYKHANQVYVFSPYALVWNEDNYYVIGFSDSHDAIVKFRVDRMAKVTLSEQAAVKKPKGFDIVFYTRKLFSMYDGELRTIRLICENSVMKSVIDHFGTKINPQRADNEHFYVDVEAAVSPTFFGWVFTYCGAIRIVSPEDILQTYADMVHNAL